MRKVFLYSRVSTSAQTLEQQERTVYEWLKNHNMTVDEVISDEGVSGGVSYADRKLGTELIPRMKEGDVLIVSEVSRLGRSMFDLSKLIHNELKPRKLRLIVVGMGIDLNCANITPIDQLILSNFSFAAELEKHLIRERTLSALQVKRKQGVKFGSASPKYRENYNNKTKEQKRKESMERGKMKNERHLAKRETQVFLKVLRNVFPEACADEDASNWNWKGITTRGEYTEKIKSVMIDYKELDESGNLFKKWDFTWDEKYFRTRLCAHIQNIRVSVLRNKKNNNQ